MGWSDLIGRQLGQYAIVGELGRGGSSRVYRAQDLERGREVAIKVIFNDAEDRVGFIRRFEREVQAIRQLNHPNIVAVYDRGETDDLVYLVMQCVTGGTLRQRCGRPIPVGEATAAIVQMCRALHHAHVNGIIHRDVKPSNMLVDAMDSRHVLLTDFGIAKLQGMLGLTKSGTTIGTPEYMSPEQAEGKDIDPRTDVYSLGCVLFELLAGRPPFVGSTAVSVLYQQVHLRPPHLRAFNSEVPRELGRIIEQALAKHPEERFGTAALLAEALVSHAQGSLPPLSNEPETVPSAPVTRSTGSGKLPGSPTGPLRGEPAARVSAPLPSYPVEIDVLSPISPMEDDAISVLPPAQATWQPVSVTSEPATDESQDWKGLAAQALDAIFPGDPEAQTSRDAHVDAIVKTPTLDEVPVVSPPARVPAPGRPSRELNRSIPLPAFRLPSKATRPLSMPITASGRLDIEALMAQIESQDRPRLDEVGEDMREVPPASPALPPPVVPASVGPAAPGRLDRLDIPDYDTDKMVALSGGSGRSREEYGRVRAVMKRRLPVASVFAAAICLVLLAGVLISVFVLGARPHSHGPGKLPARATPTLTPLPSPTVTPLREPTATATESPQQVRNDEAAAAFTSVILSQFADNSCSAGNQSRQFSPGQSVYIDLCTSGGPFPGPVTVTIHQGGAPLYVVVSNVYLSPNSGYYFYRYGLPSGSYDMVVTMPIQGTTAVARDLAFTVG